MATALNVSGTDSALIGASPRSKSSCGRRQRLIRAAPVVTAFIAVGVIYSFADVSGAHFNPAVTIATMATGKTSATKGACYIGAQLIGSLFATMFLGLVYSKDTLGVMARKLVVMPPTDVRKMDAVFSEFFSTYIFIFVIFSVVYALLREARSPSAHALDLSSFDTLDTKHVDVLEKASNENIGVRKVQARNMTIYTTSGQDKVRHTHCTNPAHLTASLVGRLRSHRYRPHARRHVPRTLCATAITRLTLVFAHDEHRILCSRPHCHSLS